MEPIPSLARTVTVGRGGWPFLRVGVLALGVLGAVVGWVSYARYSGVARLPEGVLLAAGITCTVIVNPTQN